MMSKKKHFEKIDLNFVKYFVEEFENNNLKIDNKDIARLIFNFWKLIEVDFKKQKMPLIGVDKVNLLLDEKIGVRKECSVFYICNKNRSFIFDSIISFFGGHRIKHFFSLHPVLSFSSDYRKFFGIQSRISNQEASAEEREDISLVVLIIKRNFHEESQNQLVSELEKVLQDISSVNEDWQPMCRLLEGNIKKLKKLEIDSNEVFGNYKTALSFMDWLLDDNFIFQGVRVYIRDENDAPVIFEGLGIF